MGYTSTTFVLLTIATQVFTAPQLISFKDGNVGVNFGGYHAAAGLGGLLGGGAAGGLFAEAGTPHGQKAAAGLGGATSSGGNAGGLFAGATAGGNVGAAAGLGGGVDAEKSAGVGYAVSSAGNHHAAAGLGGEAGGHGSSGFTYSSSKSYGISGGEVEQSVQPLPKKVHQEFDFDAANEVHANTNVKQKTKISVETKTKIKPEVVVQEIPEAIRRFTLRRQQSFYHKQPQKVYAEPPPQIVVEKHYFQPQPVIIEKHIIHPQPVIVEKHIHKRPHRYHNKIRVHGYIDSAGALPPPPPIQKRIDVGVESFANAGANTNAGAVANSGAGAGAVTYTKQVNFQRNPQFFADIFNIPISTLKAVGSFLGNAAGSTSVSVQKSASVSAAGAESDAISPQPGQPSSSQSQLSIQTPDASKFIEDIFAIPINTLGAVNKFLENNVPTKRRVQVSADGVEEPTRFKLGPRGRRRSTKQVTVQAPRKSEESSKDAE